MELATFAADIWLLVSVRTHTEMLDSLAGVLCTTEQDGFGSSGGAKSKLIEGERFAACLQDASSS